VEVLPVVMAELLALTVMPLIQVVMLVLKNFVVRVLVIPKEPLALVLLVVVALVLLLIAEDLVVIPLLVAMPVTVAYVANLMPPLKKANVDLSVVDKVILVVMMLWVLIYLLYLVKRVVSVPLPLNTTVLLFSSIHGAQLDLMPELPTLVTMAKFVSKVLVVPTTTTLLSGTVPLLPRLPVLV